MLGSASPRNPSVLISVKSSAWRILLVACGKNAVFKSSFSMPQPLSTTLISSRPAFTTVISTLVAPASMAFSTSSFTTEAGRSTTSPADILLYTELSNLIIFIILPSIPDPPRLKTLASAKWNSYRWRLIPPRVLGTSHWFAIQTTFLARRLPF